MKLYVYDHCPYCVKARMIFGFKNQSVKLITLLNDDEKTPLSMIGEKMVPILETGPKKFMPESLDIVRYIDKKNSSQVNWKENAACNKWLNGTHSYFYSLTMPRWVKSSMEEFKTSSARKYFQKKKEGYIGPFKEALAETPELIKECEEHLEDLEKLFKKDFLKDEWNASHFHLFAVLRGLSIVRGLTFPLKIKQYMKQMAKRSHVPLSKPN